MWVDIAYLNAFEAKIGALKPPLHNVGFCQSQYREVVCSNVYLKRESETLTLLLKLQKFCPKSIDYIYLHINEKLIFYLYKLILAIQIKNKLSN